jgi:hypothetical protein
LDRRSIPVIAEGVTAKMQRWDRARSAKRLALAAQLLATAAILGWVPTNAAKLVAMLVIWRLGFGCIRRDELIAMALVNLFFVPANRAALAGGIFSFNDPDFFGMPVYEFVMWGFYTQHAIRFVDGPSPAGGRLLPFVAAVIFALPFAWADNPVLLAVLSTVLLAAAFALFHDRLDFAYAGYMAVLGALIECVGVGTGQWHYPGRPPGGVPLWSLTMWAGVGLFTRRLIVPSLARRAER